MSNDIKLYAYTPPCRGEMTYAVMARSKEESIRIISNYIENNSEDYGINKNEWEKENFYELTVYNAGEVFTHGND